jgi:calmodulin
MEGKIEGPNDSREVFDLLDRKKSGFLKSDQLGVALRSVGLRLTNEQIRQLKAKVDAEENGQLDYESFQDYIYESKKIQKTEAELEAAFRVFDNGDGQGLIDIESFKHALTSLGDKMTPEEVDEILKEARRLGGDDDAPGTIDSRKLLHLIQSIQ